MMRISLARIAHHLVATRAHGVGYVGRHVPAPDPNTPVRVGIPLPPRRSFWRNVLPLGLIVGLLAVAAWSLTPRAAEPAARVIAGASR